MKTQIDVDKQNPAEPGGITWLTMRFDFTDDALGVDCPHPDCTATAGQWCAPEQFHPSRYRAGINAYRAAGETGGAK